MCWDILLFLSEIYGEQQTKNAEGKACCCKDDIHHCETQGNCHHLLNWYSINWNTICNNILFIVSVLFFITVSSLPGKRKEVSCGLNEPLS